MVKFLLMAVGANPQGRVPTASPGDSCPAASLPLSVPCSAGTARSRTQTLAAGECPASRPSPAHAPVP